MAIEGLKKMSCGNCGKQDYSIYLNKADAWHLECNNCKSMVRAQVASAVIQLVWTEQCEGSPCYLGDEN